MRTAEFETPVRTEKEPGHSRLGEVPANASILCAISLGMPSFA